MEESEKYMVDFYGKVLKGVENMMNTSPEDLKSDTLEKELVFQIGKSRLFHYKPLVEPDKVLKIPTMITYALVNRQYMMDIQPDRSVIRNFLEHGLDCYIVVWGYPTMEDMYMTMEDYINWYMNDADMVAIAKHARKVLIDKKILRAGMLNGRYIGLVNIHGFKDEVKKCTK